MHIKQQKHAQNMQPKYSCNHCDYHCSRKSLWTQHIMTAKHRKATESTVLQPENMQTKEKFICIHCNREYKQRSGLWRHKKTCIEEDPLMKSNMTIIVKELMSHMKIQSEQLRDQNKIINELIPKIGNNNNNKLNVNVFLNEHCKDAINMSDFLVSLKIKLSDIDYVKNAGLMEGISSVFIKGLNKLDTYKRPIHCTDIKRETLYIKNNNEWERDNGKEKIKSAIGDIAQKHRLAISEWELNNPEWSKTEKGKDEYIKLVQQLMCNVQEQYHEHKIIKSIAKSTTIQETIKY